MLDSFGVIGTRHGLKGQLLSLQKIKSVPAQDGSDPNQSSAVYDEGEQQAQKIIVGQMIKDAE